MNKFAISLTSLACISLLLGCTPTSRLQIGSEAPKIRTKTLQDVGGDMAKITTYRQPDKRMYQYSLDQALTSGKPIMLEFATPGHCTVCDRQLQEVKALLDKYQGKVIFLHMDQYENPDAFKAYKVMGDPWNFFIDGKGIVRYQQPGPMLMGEMDHAIQQMLPPTNTANN
ncbi:MAG: redoxin domain-containing protein [Betaproteobacteria bacterium]|nr:redoxin domain-containing protein [Betaproteobacteria bacterium]